MGRDSTSKQHPLQIFGRAMILIMCISSIESQSHRSITNMTSNEMPKTGGFIYLDPKIDEIHFKNSSRCLATSTSASQSVVFSSGIASSISAPMTYSIIVTAKDASGNNIGHGGDTFFIDITNKCTMDAGNNCVVDSGAKQTLASPIYDKFNDNGDGTYSYSYSVSLDGAITIVIKLATGNGLNCNWFSNNGWSGTPYLTNSLSALSFYYTTSAEFISGITDRFTGTLATKLLSPSTGTFTFYLTHDDGMKLLLNSVTKVDKQLFSCACSSTFSASLVANTYYDIVIYYFQDMGPLGVTVEWESTSLAKQVIPSTNYFTARIEYDTEISIVKDGELSFYPKSICIDYLICYHA